MDSRDFRPFGKVSALTLGGGGIGNVWGETSKEELQHAIYAVTGKRLSDLQANALLEMFDSDGDNELDSNEFFRVTRTLAARKLRACL